MEFLWCSAARKENKVHLMGLGVEQVGILGQGCGEGVVCRFQSLRFILFR